MKKNFLSMFFVFTLLGVFLAGQVVSANLNEPVSRTVELYDGENGEFEVFVNEELDQAVANFERELKKIEGVSAVMGMDIDGVPTVIVFVEEDADFDKTAEQIPDELDGFPVLIEVDYEVSIMPFNTDEIDEDGDVPELVLEETTDAGEEDGSNLPLLIGAGAAILLLLLIMLLRGKKGS